MPWGIGEEMWYSTDSGFKAKCVVLKRELENGRVLIRFRNAGGHRITRWVPMHECEQMRKTWRDGRAG